ncbi:MAG: DUF308 domain-containing protein [Oscillospiraceae bacterium]
MKNPFKTRTITPILLLLQSGIMLFFGILVIVNGDLAFRLLHWVAGISLLVAGISRAWAMFWEKKQLQGVITLTAFTLGGAVMVLFPLVVAVSVGKLFGLWFLINSIAHGTICVQCVTQKLRGKVRYGFSALFSLIFGLLLVFGDHLHLKSIFMLSGIYLLVYALTLLVDAVSEVFLYGKAGTGIKRRVRISLPLFITALLPGKLLDDFNEYFKTNPKEATKVLENSVHPSGERMPLEVFIHLSDKGTQRTGHVDLRYRHTVYSYGCYDHHSHRYNGMLSDGTMVVCDSEKYVNYCITAEEKILVGFGLALSPEQCTAIEGELAKIRKNLLPWQSDYEKGLLTDNTKDWDAASLLIHSTGCKIHKMSSGPFRKYYALNTNCVKLAEQIIGPSGIGLIDVNGICVPGTYYTLLNDLYERSDTIVVQRNIYKKMTEEEHNHVATSDDSPRKN